GVQGIVVGEWVLAGRAALLSQQGMSVPEELTTARVAAEHQGRTVVMVGWQGRVRAVLVVADAIKLSATAAVRPLRERGLSPVVVTGDSGAGAQAVARGSGSSEARSEVRADDKVRVVRRLQSEGRSGAMVGDGMKDAAALAQADLGLGMGT